LILTHEGTEQVKNAKLSMLNRDYELFTMKPYESIKYVYNHLLDIVNSLLSLGKVFENDELVRKLLGCLSNEWEHKVTAIEESKDLKPMEIEEFLGSLMTHEVKLRKKLKNQEEKKPQENKRKEIALKSTPKEDSDEDEDNEDEMILSYLRKDTRSWLSSTKEKEMSRRTSTNEMEARKTMTLPFASKATNRVT
ncbi:UBN2 domain-containing protein, partial [Cephalotus follicularis]